MKTCNTCKIEKEITQFAKNKSTKDGFNRYCKSCDAIKRKKYKNSNTKKCKIDECFKLVKTHDMCSKHHWRTITYGDPRYEKLKFCQKQGCNRKHFGKGMCEPHYQESRRNDGFFKTAERKPEYRYKKLLREAKSSNYQCDITQEQYINLIKDNSCFYCLNSLPKTSKGLDRKNSEEGYLYSNVVPCCTACNKIKSNIFSFEEMIEFSKTNLFQRIRQKLKDRYP